MVVNLAFVNYFFIHILSREGKPKCVVLISNLIQLGEEKKLNLVSFSYIDWKSFVVRCRWEVAFTIQSSPVLILDQEPITRSVQLP